MKQNDVVYLSQVRRYAEKFGYGLVVLDEAQREIPTRAGKPAIEIAEFIKLEFRRHTQPRAVMGKSFDRRSSGGSQ
jgi:hypothetical protein